MMSKTFAPSTLSPTLCPLAVVFAMLLVGTQAAFKGVPGLLAETGASCASGACLSAAEKLLTDPEDLERLLDAAECSANSTQKGTATTADQAESSTVDQQEQTQRGQRADEDEDDDEESEEGGVGIGAQEAFLQWQAQADARKGWAQGLPGAEDAQASHEMRMYKYEERRKSRIESRKQRRGEAGTKPAAFAEVLMELSASVQGDPLSGQGGADEEEADDVAKLLEGLVGLLSY